MSKFQALFEKTMKNLKPVIRKPKLMKGKKLNESEEEEDKKKDKELANKILNDPAYAGLKKILLKVKEEVKNGKIVMTYDIDDEHMRVKDVIFNDAEDDQGRVGVITYEGMIDFEYLIEIWKSTINRTGKCSMSDLEFKIKSNHDEDED